MLNVKADETWIRNTSFDFYMPGVYMEYQYNTNDMPVDYETDGSGRTYMFWHYTHKSVSPLFQTNEKYYGYNIVYTQSDTSNYFNSDNGVVNMFPMFGTQQELNSGTASQGQGWMLLMGDYASNDKVWITTNNSHNQNIYAGILFNLRTYIGTSSSQLPYLDYNLSFDCSIYGYTREEYIEALEAEINNIKSELKTQTDLSEEQVAELEEQTATMQQQLNEAQKQTSELEEQTEAQKSFFGSFFDNLKNLIVGIFVPSSEDMQAIWSRFDTFFNETFGFLYAPFDILISVFDTLMSDNDNTVFALPTLEIMGYTIIESQSVKLDELELVQQIFSYVRIVTGGILAFSLINYLRKFFDKRFGGGGN